MFWVTIGSNTNLHLTLIYLFSIVAVSLGRDEFFMLRRTPRAAKKQQLSPSVGMAQGMWGITFLFGDLYLNVVWLGVDLKNYTIKTYTQ